MKKDTSIAAITVFIIILVAGVFILYSYYSYVNKEDPYSLNQTIVIGNWNLQIFGDSKATDTDLMNRYAEVISHYDIIFLQELRDKDASSFATLCAMLPEYNCNISSRAGRSSSKEQYGMVYLKKYNLDRIIDYNVNDFNMSDEWERPPIRADFSIDNYTFSIYNIHTKPNETVQELTNLESLIVLQNNSRNIMVLGDLNADCYYYNPYNENVFMYWHWIIKDSDDTTTGSSNCAYDRIILNDDMNNEFINYGIYGDNITTNTSDHFPVWVRIRDYDYSKDKSFVGFLKTLV